jgi:hypothetical protein
MHTLTAASSHFAQLILYLCLWYGFAIPQPYFTNLYNFLKWQCAIIGTYGQLCATMDNDAL